MKVERGHIKPFWDLSFKEFRYIKKDLPTFQLEKWKEQGYDIRNVKAFDGSLYDNRYPLPSWVKQLDDKFGLFGQTYTFYRMDTFEIMPPHVDHYQTYSKLFDCGIEHIYRVLIMLEDWKPGHYLEINGEGIVNWRAGDWFKWSADVPHSAANIGLEPRYTLQVTGNDFFQKVSTVTPPITEQFNIHFFDLPGIENRLETLKNPMIMKLREVSELPEKTPIIISVLNGNLEQIHNFKITADSSTVIHFYLYEPISVKVKGEPFNQSYYSDFKYNTDPDCIEIEELDSIIKFAETNNLSRSQIIVHTGDYKIEEFYNNTYGQRLTLLCDDILIKHYGNILNKNDNYVFDLKYSFLCPNWRYTKHRHLITAYLRNLNTQYSWYYKCTLETFQQNLWFDWEDFYLRNSEVGKKIVKGIDQLNADGVKSLDIEALSVVNINDGSKPFYPLTRTYKYYETPAATNSVNMELEKHYNESFCIVVSETRFAQHTANISEKTYQAIQYKKPFILIGPPKSLEYIKTLGFKTFSDFWDESYDQETDHELRLLKIFKLFESVNNLDYFQRRKLYEDMNYIVRHNFEHLVNNFIK